MSEEFGRKNVIGVLSGEEIMCIKNIVCERGGDESDIENWKNNTELIMC